jgi:flagellar motor switch protein FliN/FliY
MTVTPVELDASHAEAAANAACQVLPSADQLTAAPAQPGNPHVASSFAGAAISRIQGGAEGLVGVLVGQDLVNALSSSPLGGLDLGAAVQPALDAAATALGGNATAAEVIECEAVADYFGETFHVVPLIGSGIVAAVLVGAGGAAASGPVVVADPEPTAADQDVPEADDEPASPVTTADMQTPISAQPHHGQIPNRGIEMLHGVVMDVTVELGRTRMSVRDLLALAPGTVLELDRAAGSPADLLVNGRLIARGEVVVVDEDFGLRVTEIVAMPSKG